MKKIEMGIATTTPLMVANGNLGKLVTIRTRDWRSRYPYLIVSTGRIKSATGTNGSECVVTFTNGKSAKVTLQSTLEIAESVSDEMVLSQFTD